MKALKYLIYFLVALAVLIGVLGVFAKNKYHVERKIEIDAPKSMVYDQIRLFKNFNEWSPWAKYDPNLQVTYSGVDGEPGASYSWAGNKDVGEGIETLKSVSPDRLDLELKFIKPIEFTAPVFFNITGDSLKTKVTWGFEPNLPFPVNIWAMFTDVDKAMGPDYEHGLGFLKRRCESMAHKKYHGYEIAEEDVPLAYYLGIRKEVDIADIMPFYQENIVKVQKYADSLKLAPASAPAGLYWTFDLKSGKSDMAAALPLKEDKKPPTGMQVYKMGGSKALIIEHQGSYEKMGEAHQAMDDYMAEFHLKSVPPVIESYVVAPLNEPDTAKWITKVIYFVEPAPDSSGIKK